MVSRTDRLEWVPETRSEVIAARQVSTGGVDLADETALGTVAAFTAPRWTEQT